MLGVGNAVKPRQALSLSLPPSNFGGNAAAEPFGGTRIGEMSNTISENGTKAFPPPTLSCSGFG